MCIRDRNWAFCFGIAILAAATGCKAIPSSGYAKQDWTRDLENADSIMVRSNNVELRIEEGDTIQRLASIYAKSKWKPYRVTLPGDLGDQTIIFYAGNEKLRHMSYTGSLWENERYDANRTATLSETDRKWIESLFDKVTKTTAESAR